MAVYLLTYNPLMYKWDGREAQLRAFARAGAAGQGVEGRWSTARKHDIGPGDETGSRSKAESSCNPSTPEQSLNSGTPMFTKLEDGEAKNESPADASLRLTASAAV